MCENTLNVILPFGYSSDNVRHTDSLPFPPFEIINAPTVVMAYKNVHLLEHMHCTTAPLYLIPLAAVTAQQFTALHFTRVDLLCFQAP